MSIQRDDAARSHALARLTSSPLAEQVFFALYHADHRPKQRWIRVIRRRLGEQQLVARGRGLVDDVFEHLATTYLVDTITRPLPGELPVEVWLHKRFGWDAYRAAEQIVRSGGMLETADCDRRDAALAQASTGDAFEAASATLLRQCIDGLLETLPPVERHAILARRLCGMSPHRAYDLLGLPRASRARANHNQAFNAGFNKLRAALHSEGWVEPR